MERDLAERLLVEHARARDALLRRITTEIQATDQALWQVGSFAAGRADEWSDLDLLVSGGPCPIGTAALRLDNPANGPVGGGYTGAAYLTGPLLIWIDWYSWPADLPAPLEAKLLAGSAPRGGGLSLFDALDQHGRGPEAQSDLSTFSMAMIPIAAKYVARGDNEAAAGMVTMLGGDRNTDPVVALRGLLRAADGPDSLAERVARMIDVAESLRP